MHRTHRPGFAQVIGLILLVLAGPVTRAADATPPEVLFRDVRVFDGKSAALSGRTDVLVRGNKIAAMGAGAVASSPSATIIDGAGRTLMPGLIDAHVHLMFATIPQVALLTADIGFVNIAAGKAAHDMLMRGFTSVRDAGGPTFGLKRAIDTGLVAGPRIWPSGAFISQTGGHGDFRLPNELPARPGDFSYAERVGAAAIADDPDTVRRATTRSTSRSTRRPSCGRPSRRPRTGAPTSRCTPTRRAPCGRRSRPACVASTTASCSTNRRRS